MQGVLLCVFTQLPNAPHSARQDGRLRKYQGRGSLTAASQGSATQETSRVCRTLGGTFLRNNLTSMQGVSSSTKRKHPGDLVLPLPVTIPGNCGRDVMGGSPPGIIY